MKKVWRVIREIEDWIMIGSFAILIALNLYNVATRLAIPALTVSFNEELSVYLFVWLCMFGGAVCFRENEHLSLPLFYNMFPQTVKAVLTVLGSIVCLFAILILIQQTTVMVINQLEKGIMAQSMAVPVAASGIAMPIGGVFIVLHVIEKSVIAVLDVLHGGQRSDKQDEEQGRCL